MADSLDFEKALEDYLPTNQEYGEVIKGKIIRKDADFAYVDINNKKEGIIALSELSDNTSVGDEIEAQISKVEEEYIVISINALERKKQFDNIEVGQVLHGKITKQLRNGYNVKVDLINTFLPFSLSAIKKGTNAVGKEVEVIVKSKGNKKILVSRIDLLNKATDEFFSKYQVGDIIEGTVTKILSFGAVVSLGTLNGFIHISEIAWSSINSIEDFLNVKDKKTFKIISIDKEDRNIKLSLKQLTDNPWHSLKAEYAVGDVVNGKVKEIYNFGAIVTLPNGADGFLHISDITTRKISEIGNLYKVGDDIKVEVTAINDDKERIQVSAKSLLEKVLSNLENEYEVGQIHVGKIVNIQDYGIFVEMDNKVEVFIHRNEFSWTKEVPEFHLGNTVKFVLIKVDAVDKKLSGSIRELTKSPWEEAAEMYQVGDILDVYVSDIIEAGALVPLTENFKALIPKKELSHDFVENTTDVVNVGDQVRVEILEINPEKRSVILSIKATQNLENEE